MRPRNKERCLATAQSLSIFLSGYSLLCAGWTSCMESANAQPFHSHQWPTLFSSPYSRSCICICICICASNSQLPLQVFLASKLGYCVWSLLCWFYSVSLAESAQNVQICLKAQGREPTHPKISSWDKDDKSITLTSKLMCYVICMIQKNGTPKKSLQSEKTSELEVPL